MNQDSLSATVQFFLMCAGLSLLGFALAAIIRVVLLLFPRK